MEKWRPIAEYEGLYEVSNYGRVRSLKRATTNGKVLHPVADKDGYLKLSLSANGKAKRYFVHRLVAEAFLPKEAGKNVINHKDEVKSNNHVSNLEWCTISYNNSYNGCSALIFPGIKEASKATMVNRGNIISCCKGKRKTAGGYSWRYASWKG